MVGQELEKKGSNTVTIVATSVGGVALVSNLALLGYCFIKKKRLF